MSRTKEKHEHTHEVETHKTIIYLCSIVLIEWLRKLVQAFSSLG